MEVSFLLVEVDGDRTRDASLLGVRCLQFHPLETSKHARVYWSFSFPKLVSRRSYNPSATVRTILRNRECMVRLRSLLTQDLRFCSLSYQ